MKKWLLGLLTAMMAVSLAACTPTTEKKQETTTTAAAAKQERLKHRLPAEPAIRYRIQM